MVAHPNIKIYRLLPLPETSSVYIQASGAIFAPLFKSSPVTCCNTVVVVVLVVIVIVIVIVNIIIIIIYNKAARLLIHTPNS